MKRLAIALACCALAGCASVPEPGLPPTRYVPVRERCPDLDPPPACVTLPGSGECVSLPGDPGRYVDREHYERLLAVSHALARLWDAYRAAHVESLRDCPPAPRGGDPP